MSGTWWSENTGEISLSGIVYDPSTGRLAWTGSSFVGDIDLSGIILPLRPAILLNTDYTSNHNAILTVSGASDYDAGDGSWDLRINPIGTPDFRNIMGSLWIFSWDITLSSTYDIIITDTNGSETSGTIDVHPSTMSSMIFAGASYISDFCTNHSSDVRCPDGASITATILDQVPPVGLFANKVDTYNFTFRPRDTYGNRITAGSVDIEYITTVKNLQSDIMENINYVGIDGDAFISPELGIGLGGSNSQQNHPLWASDLTYSIASSAPTNIDNTIILDNITHHSGSTMTVVALPKNPLIFKPIYRSSINPWSPTIGTPNTFTVTLSKDDPSTTVTPDSIHTLKIAGWANAEWRNISGSPAENCVNYPDTYNPNPLCDWSSVSSIAITTSSPISFTGTYTTLIPNPPLESTHIDSYIHYNDGGTEVLYKSDTLDTGSPSAATERVTLIGQIDKTLINNSSARIDFINQLREKRALFARNRTNFDDADVLIVQGNYTLDNNELIGSIWKKAKRTIIITGGTLYINANIDLLDHPVSLISLTSNNNQGWNIRIAWNVTDIHALLVAEHAVMSENSNSQLYVHGAIISANAPREIAPSSCPYFAPLWCVKSDYDLPASRSSYASPVNASIGWATYVTPIVVEWDARVTTDPPPGFTK